MADKHNALLRSRVSGDPQTPRGCWSLDQPPLVSEDEDQEEDEGPPQEGQAGSGQSGGRDEGMGLACGPQQEVKL